MQRTGNCAVQNIDEVVFSTATSGIKASSSREIEADLH